MVADPAFISSAQTVHEVDPRTSYYAPVPASLAAGNLIIVQFAHDITASNPLTATPSGWTAGVAYTEKTAGGSSWLGAGVWWHIVTADEAASPPSSWGPWTFTSAVDGTISSAQYGPVDTADPFSSSFGTSWLTTTSSTPTGPAVSVDTDGSRMIGGACARSGSVTWTIDTTGWTKRADTGGLGARVQVTADKTALQNTGTSAAVQFHTSSGSNVTFAWQVALKPAPAPSGVTGAAASLLPAITQAATGTVESAGIAGTAASILPALTQSAAASFTTDPSVLPGSGPVGALAETDVFTEGTAPEADDPAILIHPTDPASSVIIGTNKSSSGGGLGVFDLSGTKTDFLTVGKMNNVDNRAGALGFDELLVSSNRTTNALDYFSWDWATETLTAIGSTSLSFEPYGCALYVSPIDGTVYAYVTENAATNGAFNQYELSESGGVVSGTPVRTMTTPSLAEGLAADDVNGVIFISVEDVAFQVLGAEPSDSATRTTVDAVGGGHLVADVEGCDIAYDRAGGAGYVLVSSQGNSTFHVYDLLSPYAWRKSFTIVADVVDGSTDCDGLSVTRKYLGPDWPNGIVVVQDGANAPSGTNFKYADAADILGGYDSYTGTAASTLPALTQTAAGTFADTSVTGTAATVLPSLTQSASGATTAPAFTGSAISTLSALTQTAAGQTNPPHFTGTATTTLPPLGQAATGTITPPATTGTAASVLPALTQHATGEVTNTGIAGTAASVLPGLTQTAAGTTTVPSYTGTADSKLAALVQSATGTVTDLFRTGTAASLLPPLTQSATGTYLPRPINGTAVSVLPSLRQTAAAVFTPEHGAWRDITIRARDRQSSIRAADRQSRIAARDRQSRIHAQERTT